MKKSDNFSIEYRTIYLWAVYGKITDSFAQNNTSNSKYNATYNL